MALRRIYVALGSKGLRVKINIKITKFTFPLKYRFLKIYNSEEYLYCDRNLKSILR